MGLLWRSGSGACPNLLQRRPRPGSVAEYQRFFSDAPARSGPLQQILTNRADMDPGMGGTGRDDGPLDAPLTPRRALCTRKCSSNRHFRVQNAHLGEEAGRSRSSRTAVPDPDGAHGVRGAPGAGSVMIQDRGPSPTASGRIRPGTAPPRAGCVTAPRGAPPSASGSPACSRAHSPLFRGLSFRRASHRRARGRVTTPRGSPRERLT